MQDFRKYDFTLTIDRLKEIQAEYDGPILVVINGEYYELKNDNEKVRA